jgi:hypothetical protein
MLCGVCVIDSLCQKFVSGINELTKDEESCITTLVEVVYTRYRDKNGWRYIWLDSATDSCCWRAASLGPLSI